MENYYEESDVEKRRTARIGGVQKVFIVVGLRLTPSTRMLTIGDGW